MPALQRGAKISYGPNCRLLSQALVATIPGHVTLYGYVSEAPLVQFVRLTRRYSVLLLHSKDGKYRIHAAVTGLVEGS